MSDSRVLNHIQTAVAVIDKNMIVIDANASFAARNNSQIADVIGKKCYEAAYQFDKPCNNKTEKKCPFYEVLQSKNTTSSIHHYWIEDHAVVEEISTTPVKDDNGEVEYIVEEFRDVTKLLGLDKGIISTCSYCNKIRDENNEWVNFDIYLNRHTGADFSHGICEECNENLFSHIHKGDS